MNRSRVLRRLARWERYLRRYGRTATTPDGYTRTWIKARTARPHRSTP